MEGRADMIAAPFGSEGVKAYRFMHAQLGQTVYEGEMGRDFITWFVDHQDTDGFWTNGFTREYHATASVMRNLDIPVVVDVDDYFDEVPSGNTALVSWHGRRKKEYGHMLANADRRVCSTPFLAETYDAEVAPNFLDTEAWDWPQRERDPERCVLLHCGSVNRAGDYLAQEQAFRAFLALPHTQIVLMGWMPKWARDYEPGKVVFCRWTEYAKYPRMLRWLAPDIVVSPLEHNKFNLAKSNIKWLEAGALGACFVGERWGEYERTVDDGATGVLADGTAEWTERLLELASDKDLRDGIGEAGQEAVYSRYTWDSVAPAWERAVFGKGVVT